MLILFTLVPILLVAMWLLAEFRGRTWIRVAAGLVAMILVAITAYLWGGFGEAFKHTEFPVPHDSPADAAFMDATDKGATNTLSK